MSGSEKSRPPTLAVVAVVVAAALLGVDPGPFLKLLGRESAQPTPAPVASRPPATPAPTVRPTRRPAGPSGGMGIQGVPLPTSAEAFFAQLHELDRSLAAPVKMRERREETGPLLFEDLSRPEDLHPSYEATFELCKKMDPWDRDDTEVSVDEQRAYLATMVDTLPIRAALKIAGGDMESLRKVWFGAGRGVEHILCGESGGKRGDPDPKLGGYHFWYTHYRYAREGKASYDGSDYRKDRWDRGMADPGLVTARFRLDVDGPGPRPEMDKRPRGGFAVGNSAPGLLALGYVIAKLKPEAPVRANLTGKTYGWRYHMDYRDDSSLRTLWPGY